MTLAEYLASRNLTQAEFAAKVGVEQATIGRYAKGERFPRQRHLEAIERETGGLVSAQDHVETWRLYQERATA